MNKMLKYLLPALMAALATTTFATDYELGDFVLSSARAKGIGAFRMAATGSAFYRLTDNGTRVTLEQLDGDGSKYAVFVDNDKLLGDHPTNWDGYEMSPDGLHALLWADETPIYRYSFSADYYVCDVLGHSVEPLSDAGGEEIATLSPDGKKVAYVKDNNVYIKRLDTGETITVTTDGRKNAIIYGVPDWVYQEEFGQLNTLTWNPTSDELAFVRWDESEVPMCSIERYEGDCRPDSTARLHPSRFDYKYPAAGEKNSVVNVMRYSLSQKRLYEVAVPKSDDDYIPAIAYSGTRPDARLMVNRLNRAQNDWHLYMADADGTCHEIYNEQTDIWFNPSVITGAKYYDDFFVIQSNRNGFNHLYKYSLPDGRLLAQLTNGDYEVTAYYGYDAKRKCYYVQTTNGPLNRVVRRVDKNGKATLLSEPEGTSTATFAGDFSHYILNYSNVNTPNTYKVYSTAKNKCVRVLEDNSRYAARYDTPAVPRREFVTLPLDGYTLNGYIILPPNFDAAKRYPCIMSQYGGPGSQEVLNRWKVDWEEYFAMQGFVVACFDGRGTGARGKEFLRHAYLNLGKYDTEDQVKAARYMASQPYVDPDRIGIYGWSYGGFEALMCLSQPDAPYAAGVAIAPVTSWRFYDSIYTERFMLTPDENPEGYDNAPLDLYHDLQGRLLLIFGSADDNVRIVNSMQYLAKLNGDGRQIDLMVYPNMNHSINGCDIRAHLYQKMLDFFTETLK